LLAAVLSFVLYLIASWVRHSRYQSGIDLTIFGQAIREYGAFQPPYVALKAREPFNVLGDHFSPIIAVIAPVYRLLPHIEVLLVTQAGLFAWSVYLISRLAHKKLGSRLGVWLAVCYVLSPGVMSAVSFDFHEVCFAVPTVILAIDAAIEKQWRRLAVLSILLFLVKEDSTFLLAGIALMLLARHEIKTGLILGGSSVVAFIGLVGIVIPFFSYYGRYTYLPSDSGETSGILQTAVLMLQQPEVWSSLLLVLVTCGPGLRSPVFLVIVPTLLSRLVTHNTSYWNVALHYWATLTAACFVALIDGLAIFHARHEESFSFRVSCRIHLGLVFGVSLITTQLVIGWTNVFGLSNHPEKAEEFSEVVQEVPIGAAIIADAYATSHLADTNTVYLANASWTDSTGQPLVADWVLLDETSPVDENPDRRWVTAREESLSRDGFSVVDRQGPIVLWHKE